jgi:hypothetical protein
MNQTRRDWSSVYKCYKDKRDSLTAFYSLASAIIFIAVSFYGSVYYIGIKYPSTETLDQRDISGGNPTPGHGHGSSSSAPAPGPSSSSTQPRLTAKKANKMSVNNDDSDHDDILSGDSSNNPVNQNLITLDVN